MTFWMLFFPYFWLNHSMYICMLESIEIKPKYCSCMVPATFHDREQFLLWHSKLMLLSPYWSDACMVLAEKSVCVHMPLRLLITSGITWCDMHPIWLVKQVLQLLYAALFGIVSKHGFKKELHHRNRLRSAVTFTSSHLYNICA